MKTSCMCRSTESFRPVKGSVRPAGRSLRSFGEEKPRRDTVICTKWPKGHEGGTTGIGFSPLTGAGIFILEINDFLRRNGNGLQQDFTSAGDRFPHAGKPAEKGTGLCGFLEGTRPLSPENRKEKKGRGSHLRSPRWPSLCKRQDSYRPCPEQDSEGYHYPLQAYGRL